MNVDKLRESLENHDIYKLKIERLERFIKSSEFGQYHIGAYTKSNSHITDYLNKYYTSIDIEKESVIEAAKHSLNIYKNRLEEIEKELK